MSILKPYFPDIYFTTLVSQSGDTTTMTVQNKESKLCLEMIINANVPDVLTVKQIKKCNKTLDEPGTGTYILSCIKNIAHDLKIKKIVIDTDVSSIHIQCGKKDFSFSLKYLFLFSTGKTWYEKHGFKLQYNSEKFYEDMQKFISQEFISSQSDQSILGQSILGQSILGQSILGQSILGKSILGQSILGQSILGQSISSGQSILVKDYFKNMHENLKHETNCDTIQKYHNELQKYIKLWKSKFNYKDDGPYILAKGKRKSKKLNLKKSKKLTRSS
jgi:hypothetical protein